jgi:polar amino acid transport system permease protein
MTLALSYPQSLIEKKYSRTRSRVANGPGPAPTGQIPLDATLGGEAR